MKDPQHAAPLVMSQAGKNEDRVSGADGAVNGDGEAS